MVTGSLSRTLLIHNMSKMYHRLTKRYKKKKILQKNAGQCNSEIDLKNSSLRRLKKKN